MVVTLVLLFCFSPMADRPQDIVWQLPDQSAAVYERTFKVLVTEKEEEGPDRWRNTIPTSPIHSSLLYEAELDPNKQYVQSPVYGIQDLARQAAFNLVFASQKRRRHTLHLMSDDGTRAAKVSLEYGPMDDGGEQVVRGKIEYDKEHSLERDDYYYLGEISGELRITRLVDRTAGRVSRFHSEIDLDWKEYSARSDVKRGKVAIREVWTWKEDVLAHDLKLRSSMARGIMKARTWVKESLLQGRLRDDWSKREGLLADLGLILTCLVESDAAGEDPLLKKAFDRLRAGRLEGEEALSWALTAFAALYGSHSGEIPKEDQKKIEAWAQEILHLMEDGRRGASKRLWWTQPEYMRYDNRRALLAVQGLHAAQRCGVKIKASVWRDAALHWLDTQKVTGSTAVTFEMEMGEGSLPEKKRFKSIPITWSDMDHFENRGETVAAALLCLTICREELEKKGDTYRSEIARIDKALAGGYAWLAERFSVRVNPGSSRYWYRERMEYLYYLREAFDMAGIRSIQGWNLQFNGRMELWNRQREDGIWDHYKATCFALLFLKS